MNAEGPPAGEPARHASSTQRAGQERAPAPTAGPAGQKPRTWLQRHGSAVSNTLLLLGAVFLLLAAVFAWAQDTVFDAGGFADAATESVKNDAVQDRLATRLADRIIADDPERARARPLIKGAALAIIDTSQFEAIFRAAVERLHERLFDEDRNELVLDLSAALVMIVELVRIASPELGARIPTEVQSGLVNLSESDVRTRLIELSDRVGFLAFVFPVLALAAFGAAIYVAPGRGDATFRLGIALAVVAAAVLVMLAVGNYVLGESVRNPANRSAVQGIWWAFADSLRFSMRITALVGILIAVGAWWVGNNGWPWAQPAGRASRGASASTPLTPHKTRG